MYNKILRGEETNFLNPYMATQSECLVFHCKSSLKFAVIEEIILRSGLTMRDTRINRITEKHPIINAIACFWDADSAALSIKRLTRVIRIKSIVLSKTMTSAM